jgi:FkbM family methyltransferase
LPRILTKFVPFGAQRRILEFVVRVVAALEPAPKITFASSAVYLMPKDRSSAHILVSYWIWGRWSHERFQQHLVTQIIQTRANEVIFVDGGASFGMYSLLAAEQGATRVVVAIEADPHTFKYLERTVTESALAEKVQCMNAAIVDRSDRVVAISRVGKTNSEWTQVRLLDHFEAESPTILSVTIREIIDGSRPRENDSIIIKLDIEGAEPLAIAGMKSFLNEERDTILFLEFHAGVLNRFPGEAKQFATELWKTNMAGIYSINERDQTLEQLSDLETFLNFVSRLSDQEFPFNLTNLLLTKKPLTVPGLEIRNYEE